MASLSKIVLHFADGSTHDVQPGAGKSIYTHEQRARKCGHEVPPKPENAQAGRATNDAGATLSATAAGGKCYWVNDVLVCD